MSSSVLNNNSTYCCFAKTSVKQEDITCVFEAFKNLSEEKLLCVLIENQLKWKISPCSLTQPVRNNLLSKLKASLQIMRSIEPDPQCGQEKIIVPLQSYSYSGQKNLISREVKAGILQINKAPTLSTDSLDYAYSLSGIQQKYSDISKYIEPLSHLIDKSWSSILGYILWLPHTLSDYERYSYLAHLFWIIAYSGIAESFFECKESSSCKDQELEESARALHSFYDEHYVKMARISELFSCNSSVDVLRVVNELKKCA